LIEYLYISAQKSIIFRDNKPSQMLAFKTDNTYGDNHAVDKILYISESK